MRSYSRTRAWTDEQFDAATERLRSRGLLDDGAFTDAGPDAREAIEDETDGRCSRRSTRSATTSTSCSRSSRPWGQAVRDAKGYPASGPHDLAEAHALSPSLVRADRSDG